MWHKAEWIGHPMRIELTRVGLLVKLANCYTIKGAQQGQSYRAFSENQTYWVKMLYRESPCILANVLGGNILVSSNSSCAIIYLILD